MPSPQQHIFFSDENHHSLQPISASLRLPRNDDLNVQIGQKVISKYPSHVFGEMQGKGFIQDQ